MLLDCTVIVFPPSTIKGWVNNSFVSLAVKAADFIAVILSFKTVTVGVLADVTFNDLIKYVSLTNGLPDPKMLTHYL